MRPPRWIWLLLLLALVRPEAAQRRVRAERGGPGRPGVPNLLILIGDDHAGGTLGIDGDPRRATPRLDRLARQGVRFDRAYCNAPVCTPSRQSFLTGRLPHAVGVTLLTTPLPEDSLTLGDWLGELGYATGAIGKMHFNSPAAYGFEERIDTPEWRRFLRRHPPAGGDRRRPWRPFVDPAAVWLNAANRDMGLPESAMEATFLASQAADFIVRHKDEPFALVVGFHEPHSPFPYPREYAGRYRKEQFPTPPLSESDRREQPLIFRGLTPEQIQGIQAAYYTSLASLDHQVGRILDALDASGLAEDTIVVYWGDNGYMLGQHGRFEKHCFYEPAVRVPLIVRWPGHLPTDRRVAELVEVVDLFPTLMELCGLPNPPDLHGRSLVPLLKGGPGAKGREYVFSEYLENEEAMIRSGRFKLIVGTGRRRRQDGYATANPTPGPYQRLYDLQADPGETTDVSDRPDLAPALTDLRHQLFERLATTRDGREPVPSGLSELEAIHWCLIPRDAARE
jgi:choline-sulfatase